MLARIVFGVVQGIVWFLISLPFEVLGLLVVVGMWFLRDRSLKRVPWILLIWANPEDWTGGWLGMKPGEYCLPPRFREPAHFDDVDRNRLQAIWASLRRFWSFYSYHALRNRAHGLRNFDWYNLRLKSGQIQWLGNVYCREYKDWWIWKNHAPEAGSTYWHLTWQGWAIGFNYMRYFRFRGKLRWMNIKGGWRVTPKDARYGRQQNSQRWRHGASYAHVLLPRFGIAGSDYDE